jgi:3-methyladenine DNA glycosylase AlkC
MAAALKDEMNSQVVEQLASELHAGCEAFDSIAFAEAIESKLESLELKDRINLIADTIAEHLPSDYPTALAVVEAVARTEIDAWGAWPLCSFVERHGTDDPVASLEAMPTLTKRWSCEFAIRPFLDRHLELTRQYMRRWVDDDDEAVRRLPSEGTRPFLPWGPKVQGLIDDPRIGLELMTRLRHDPSETVRRSVANHLNDIAKFEPELVIEVLRGWTEEDPPVEPKMVTHALRTLVKRGHSGALELLGFNSDPQVSMAGFSCIPADVRMGDQIVLTATLTSTSPDDQQLVVDFVVHHVNANGETSPKVFKWTNLQLAHGETAVLTKRRTIQHASTRTYRSGTHHVDLQVGGKAMASTQFEVDAS